MTEFVVNICEVTVNFTTTLNKLFFVSDGLSWPQTLLYFVLASWCVRDILYFRTWRNVVTSKKWNHCDLHHNVYFFFFFIHDRFSGEQLDLFCVCTSLMICARCMDLICQVQILWKYFCLLAPIIFVVSTKCIDPWVLEFMVSNITGNNQLGNCISLEFHFRGLNWPRNQRKLESHD